MTERRPNPAIHDYCRPCFGWGSTTVHKGTDYQDEIECLDSNGSGRQATKHEIRRQPMTLSTPKSELTSSRMFARRSHAEVAYWIDTDVAAMDGQPGRNNHVAATRSAAERLLAAHDALGFIDQTIYANEDSSPLTPWRNEEVLQLLTEIRIKLLAEPADVETRGDS